MAISPTVNPTQPSWPGIVTERPASRLDVDGQASPAPMRILSSNESIAQQVEEFLEPLADRYLNGRNYSAEERSALSQELDLVVLESLQLVRGIYPPTVSLIRLFFKLNNSNRYSLAPKCSIEITKALHQCDGIQLQSLPHESLLVSSTTVRHPSISSRIHPMD